MTKAELAARELDLATANAQLESNAKALERDNNTAAELSAIRGEMAESDRKFEEKLSTTRVTKEIRYVTKDGVEGVCTQRDPAPYRLQFNEAVNGGPASP